jgi:aerotaxis receptor
LGLVEIYQGKYSKSGSHMRAEYRILTAGRRVVSGFAEEELIGKAHNIVRHPDMPPEAFADLRRAPRCT